MRNLDFIKRQILRYRDLLADLSRKNRELYYRESRGHCISLTKIPTVEEGFIELMASKFWPLRAHSPIFQNLLDHTSFNLSEHFLLDETNNVELIKKLDKIRSADNKFEREYGVSSAWLLGPFLCWRDTAAYKPEEILISPVFKMAIDLKRDKRKRWNLKLGEATLQINPSLRLALRQKWGISLPEQFDSENAIKALEEFKSYFDQSGKTLIFDHSTYDSVPKIPPRYRITKDEHGEIIARTPIKLEEALSKKDYALYNKVTHQHFVLLDLILIDHLNASRTALLRDYDSILEGAEIHPILAELFLGRPIPSERGNDYERVRELDGYKERENYFVVNIDSSQHRAIDQAAKRQVVVIQGPPGTGKSQTITNLIAEALAKGKKILFVSEKRAALDVVYSRLQQADLASQAVLIHSSDLNKQMLYNSFLELAESTHDPSTEQQWGEIAERLDNLKTEINCYYQVLESKHNPSGLAISELLSSSALYATRDDINIELAKVFSRCPLGELLHVCSVLDELQAKVKKIPEFSTHPWLYRHKETIFTASFLQKLKALVEQLKASEIQLKKLEIKAANLGIDNIRLLPSANILQEMSKIHIPAEWINFSSAFYAEPTAASVYQQNLERIISVIEKEKPYYSLVTTGADTDIVRQLEAYYSLKHGLLDWCSPTFWRMKSYRQQYLSAWDGTNKAFKAYRIIQEAIKEFKSVEQNKRLPNTMDETNPQIVIDTYQIALQIIKKVTSIGMVLKDIGLLQEDKFKNITCESLEEIKKLFSGLAETKKDIENCLNTLHQQKTDLYSYFEQQPALEDLKDNGAFYDTLIRSVDGLTLLDQVDLCFNKLQALLKSPFPKKALVETLVPIETSWGSYVHTVVMRWWLDELSSKNPELRNFDQETFQIKVTQFKELESKHKLSARRFINNTVSQRWKKGTGEFEGLTLLRREARKQNKVLSPREVMERGALSAMFKLKPCWLMSPLSTSQILPIEAGLFDTIIFDEASQVRVEDAIPSIYRAKAMVVVGDPKQMPPTNFFSAGEFREEDDDEETEITESILDLAAQIYPTEILEWHYRSRSESLIAFSNRAFYGGRLIAAPNPYFITEDEAIKFHEINNAYFNQKNGNLVEAEAIVDRLLYLLKTMPNKSFGIIAMGQAQMQAIEEAIERRQLLDAEFQHIIENARAYSDGETDASLFVKNLENVQGDERDIILISVGYAPSSPGKKVYMNFGPLFKQGGGRQLNVAITHAKQKIEIFCSFNPNQIPTDENDFGKNPDLVIFGRYLKYAKAISNKQYSEAKAILDSFGVGGAITHRKSSNFSKDVRRRLEELGYKVSEEIGSNGFYIDLGIHHPVIPSNFILGIECDGALFHSAPYARDRDKIRQELLEARGWKITRVWSQDWSKDWRSEITKIDAILKGILNGEGRFDSIKFHQIENL